ncbi:MAG: hypothetical protein HRU38_09050 [Saccharospirillaceae bacterium]|nr:hypothetical protein [Pseudomonadales bacterium]NRB78801.1 hypothetical protein [Saccharospirillaceae bacterium]
MKLTYLFTIALIFPSTLYANDLVNQLFFQNNGLTPNSANSISLTDQRFNIDSYQYQLNQFSIKQDLKWGALNFKQQLRSNRFNNNELTFLHNQNNQNINLIINYRYGKINIGNHSQSILIKPKKQFSVEYAQFSTDNQLFLELANFKIKESFKSHLYQLKFDYKINNNKSLNLTCESKINPGNCHRFKFNYQQGHHQFAVDHSNNTFEYSDNNIQSDDFQIKYRLKSEIKNTGIYYQKERTRYGLQSTTGEISPFIDLYYLNTAANSLGLGRKILFSKFDFNKTNLFVEKSSSINAHSFLARFDYSFIHISDFIYRDYESLLFLGIPILNQSVKVKSIDLHLARVQFKYSYQFESALLSINAQQLIYWNDTNFNSELKDDEIKLTATDVTETTKDDDKQFHWWDGLNLTMVIQWEL